MKVALFLMFSLLACQANALTMSNNTCNSSTGNITVLVEASAWDVLYHGHVIFRVRNSELQWKEVSKPMNYGKNTYAFSTFQETSLTDVSQYNIATDKTTIIVAPCNN